MKSIDTDNLAIAFGYKNNTDLRFTYFVYRLLQFPRLLKFFTRGADVIIKYNLPLKFLIRKTVFKIFCAGENLEEAFGVVNKLHDYHVGTVLDYVSEGEKTRVAFVRNASIIVQNIIRLGKESPGNYISVKVSGLEDPLFLKKVNSGEYLNVPIYNQRMNELQKRLDTICETAANHGVVVFIDAEDYFMQDTLDRLTERMMEMYNRKEVIVYNTLQMYLKDRPAYIAHLKYAGKERGYIPGIKLVRGAYVEREREAALAEGRPSPVYDTKKETDLAFDAAVETCLKAYPSVRTCVATHNDQSTAWAIECMKKYNIPNGEVKFSQLYGMSDNLTFNLAANGYSTSKYLPYGEVKKAVPYLMRRAEENSSINGQVCREATRLKQEIKRRQAEKIKK